MATDKVKVAVRVRPFNRREIELSTQCVLEMGDQQTILHHPSSTKGESRKQPKTFAFDHCFWSFNENDDHYASQEEVYKSLGADILDNAFQGSIMSSRSIKALSCLRLLYIKPILFNKR